MRIYVFKFYKHLRPFFKKMFLAQYAQETMNVFGLRKAQLYLNYLYYFQ